MKKFLLRRFVQMLVTLATVSFISFLVIELPPGDFLSVVEANLEDQFFTEEQIEAELAGFRDRFGLDQPWIVRYLRWIGGLLRGDLGYSMAFGASGNDLVGERLALSVTISVATILFSLAVAIPIGLYSAVRQYSIADHFFTFLGFIGLATPNFLLALLLMFMAVFVFNASSIGGLFSADYVAASWSIPKVVDLMKHLWLPIIIIGTAGTAGTIRVVRARMLDTLGEPFIQTARMKGLTERRVVTRHALRVAMNPVVSGMGLQMPQVIEGETLTAIVLALPTIGPLLLMAVLAEDMLIAGR